MFERFRRHLFVTAWGRNLAVDLSLAYGAGALDVVERELLAIEISEDDREILLHAATELRALWPMDARPVGSAGLAGGPFEESSKASGPARSVEPGEPHPEHFAERPSAADAAASVAADPARSGIWNAASRFVRGSRPGVRNFRGVAHS